MKKHITGRQSPKAATRRQQLTVGMDLGDRASRYCLLDETGEVLREDSVPTTRKGLTRAFAQWGRCRIALEVGTRSPWVSRLLQSLGHEGIVANPRQGKLISQSSRKNDRR
jgi:transposase